MEGVMDIRVCLRELCEGMDGVNAVGEKRGALIWQSV